MKYRMKKYLDNKWLFLFLIIILVILFRLPSLSQPFDSNSGANAYHARLILNGEPLYGTHHTGHHLPGVYYTYVLGFILLGDNTSSVKILLIPWTSVTAYLIYLLGIRLKGSILGALAALIYILLSSHKLLSGTSAESELFANLPITASILLTLFLTLNESRSWMFLWIGALCAFSFLYKVVFLTPLIVSSLVIIFDAYLILDFRILWNTVATRITWMIIGFTVPLLMVAVLFARAGLWSRFMLIFEHGRSYVEYLNNDVSVIAVFILPIAVLSFNNIILIILGMKGAIRLVRMIKKDIIFNRSLTITGTAILLWFLLSFFVAGITRKGWPHYSLIVIPSLSILAAFEIIQLNRIFLSKSLTRKRPSWLLPTILIISILLISSITNFNQYYYYILYKLGYESYEGYVTNSSYDDSINLVSIIHTAEHIKTHSSPDDYIYAWSDYAQIYYLAERRAPIDIIWPTYAESTGPYERIFSSKTKFIIVGKSYLAETPDWLYKEIAKSYGFDEKIGDQIIYRRNDS